MRVHLVLEQFDVAGARWIATCGDVDAGVALLRLPPGLNARRTFRLFEGLCLAVGGDPDVLHGNRSATSEERFARAWFTVHNIATLVIPGADLINAKLLNKALTFAQDVAVSDVWLIADSAPAPLAHGHEPYSEKTFADLQAAVPSRPPGPPTEGAVLPASLPLPTVDFIVARAEARRLLDAPLFARYDALWTRAFSATIELDILASDDLDETVTRHLEALLDGCHNQVELQVACDAMRAALLTLGIRLKKFDREALLARAAIRPSTAQRRPHHYRRLRAYRRPWRPAVVALYAAGLTVSQIRRLRISDVLDEAVAVAGERIALPSAAIEFVQAQLHVRRQVTRHEHEPFIVHDDDNELVQADTIERQLRAAAEEVGFPLEQTPLARSVRRPTVHGSAIRCERLAEVTLPVSLGEIVELDPIAKDETTHVGRVIRARRRDLGLTLEDLARHAGLRARALRHTEDTGELSALSADQLLSIASRLALKLPAGGQAAAAERLSADVDEDPALLGALLMQTGALVPREIVCDELSWDLERTVAAGKRLDEFLQPAGLAVRSTRGKLAIVPQHDLVDVQTMQQIQRRHRSRRTLGRADALLLLHTLDPDVPLCQRPHQARSRLRRAGLLTDDSLELVDDVRFSLALADPTPTAACPQEWSHVVDDAEGTVDHTPR